MWQRMFKWERRFYWLDGGGDTGGGVDVDTESPGIQVDTQTGTTMTMPGMTNINQGPEIDTGGAAIGYGSGSASPGGAGGGPLVLSASGGETVKEKEKEVDAVKKVTKKRRTTLLTAENGLLSGQGIRKSLIAGR